MTALEKMKAWLQTFPLWQGELQVDVSGAMPGEQGLFPQGIQEISRKTDVSGNVTAINRLRFLLYRMAPLGQEEHSLWLLKLQDWIQRQSGEGLAPQFGDDPQRERIRAEKGRLLSAPQSGTGRYAVEITADYILYL